MSRPLGFTLIELVTALVVTGVVALLIYGSAQLGLDTQERLAEHRRALQSARAMRALISDALRNARPALAPGDPAFVVKDDRDSEGRPRDRVSFIAAGGVAPLAPEFDWAVTLEAASEGLVFSARPVGVRGDAEFVARLAAITGLDVRVLAFGSRETWVETWPFRSIVPAAVEIVTWDDGGPASAPLRLALPLGRGRQ